MVRRRNSKCWAYAFSILRYETVLADILIKNERRQHILDKLGFEILKQDEMFRSYPLTQDQYFKRFHDSDDPSSKANKEGVDNLRPSVNKFALVK